MAVYQRGGKWWYEFRFQGQRIRESADTTSKTAAVKIERERRRQLELSAGGVRRQRAFLFSVASKAWLTENAHWSNSTREIYELKLSHLTPVFGRLLLTDITPSDISKFQRTRQKSGASGREINMETAVLRMVLRKHRLWHYLEPDFRPLREREEVGKALTDDEVHRLLLAARKSRSRSLYPALVILFNTGLRLTELRLLKWRQIDLLAQTLTVGESKTEGGSGRIVPLNDEAFAALMEWRGRFDNPLPSHYLFPTERYGLAGDEGQRTGTVAVWNINPEIPIGSWKVAWTACRAAANVSCRLHDTRHTFIQRLAEAKISDNVVTGLAGWMSRKMIERYSHSRNEAKKQAVRRIGNRKTKGESPQIPPQ